MSTLAAPDWLIAADADPVSAIREGLPFETLQVLKQRLRLPDDVLGRLLGVSPRTLRRRAADHARLSREESDRLWRVAQVYRLAVDVFEDEGRARDWLGASHRMLGGETPIEHMDTAAGVDRVRYVLHQIEYSMPV